MNEWHVVYEASPDIPRPMVRAMMDNIFNRGLRQRGLTAEQVARETLLDGEPHEGALRYCDRVVVPG
jgi:hypothetical protein